MEVAKLTEDFDASGKASEPVPRVTESESGSGLGACRTWLCRISRLSHPRSSSEFLSRFHRCHHLSPLAPTTGWLLPFRRPTPFCFSFAPRYDGEDGGSHRLRSTATPQARLVLLLLYLADLQWRGYSVIFSMNPQRTRKIDDVWNSEKFIYWS